MLADNQPMIVASCNAMFKHVNSLIVVDGERGNELDDSLAQLPFSIQRVHCADARSGMGASLKAGLAASMQADAWVVGLADMPYIADATIAKVCAALRAGSSIVRPFYQGQRGHPVGIAASLRDELLALPDNAGAAKLIQRHPDMVLRLDVDDPGSVADIDYPSDMHVTN